MYIHVYIYLHLYLYFSPYLSLYIYTYTHLYTVMLRSHECLFPNPFYPSTNPSPPLSPLRSLRPSPFPPPLVTSPFSFFSRLPTPRFPSPGPTPATSTYSSTPQHPPPTSAATPVCHSIPPHPIMAVPRRPEAVPLLLSQPQQIASIR